jgi:Glucose / Sorbosone dehydrogenase
MPQPYYNHNGGGMEFGPDGYLYIGKGDGGWEGDPLDAGQRLDTTTGKILRINVDVADDSMPYLVPKDNPFASAASPRLMSLFGVTEEQLFIRTFAVLLIWSADTTFGLLGSTVTRTMTEAPLTIHPVRCGV